MHFVCGNPSQKVQDYALTIHSASYFTVERITFFGTTLISEPPDMYTVRHLEVLNSEFMFPSVSRRLVGECGMPKMTRIYTSSTWLLTLSN